MSTLQKPISTATDATPDRRTLASLGVLQRKPLRSVESPDISPAVNDVLRSSGRPLDAATRAFVEPRFGHDFSRVRVHTDVRAAQSARDVDAAAYTVGRDVVFAAGQYAPETERGMRLVAHELSHAVQQERNCAASTRADASESEKEADQASRQIASLARPVRISRSAQRGVAKQSASAVVGPVESVEQEILKDLAQAKSAGVDAIPPEHPLWKKLSPLWMVTMLSVLDRANQLGDLPALDRGVERAASVGNERIRVAVDAVKLRARQPVVATSDEDFSQRLKKLPPQQQAEILHYLTAGGRTVFVVPDLRPGQMPALPKEWTRPSDGPKKAGDPKQQPKADDRPQQLEPTREPPRAKAKEGEGPMGGTYDDYKSNPDYVDNFDEAAYDPSSKTLHLFFRDGGEAILSMPVLNRTTAGPVLVFEWKSFLDKPGPNDFKIYPTIRNKTTLPHVAGWLSENEADMQQSDALLQAGIGAAKARSVPDNLWWLPAAAPAGRLGARFFALRMRPSFGTGPEPGERPIIRTRGSQTLSSGSGSRTAGTGTTTSGTPEPAAPRPPTPGLVGTGTPAPVPPKSPAPVPKPAVALAPGMSTGEAAEAAALKPSRPNATLLGEKSGGYDAFQGGEKIVNSQTPSKDGAGNPIVIRDVTIRNPDDAIQIKTITQIDMYGRPTSKPLPELVKGNVLDAMRNVYNPKITWARARTPLPGTNIYERTNVVSPKKFTIIVQVPGEVTEEMRSAGVNAAKNDTMAAELPPIEVVVQTKQ